jgi:hypothetical protein
MKVIKRDNWGIIVRCTGIGNGNKGCGCLLHVVPKDIYVTSSTDYLGDTEHYYTVRCPECGAETDIPDDKVYKLYRNDEIDEYNISGRSYIKK